MRSDALRVNIDITSLYAYWDLWDSRETVHHICTSLAGHYGLGHIKEIALAEGFHIHAGLAPLGQGVTDWAEALKVHSLILPQRALCFGDALAGAKNNPPDGKVNGRVNQKPDEATIAPCVRQRRLVQQKAL